MNFKETSSETLEPRNLQHQTQDDQESVLQLFELEDDTALSITLLQVGAGPPDQLAKFPPRFQSLITKQFIFLNKQKEAYFFGRYNEQPKEVTLAPPKIWAELGNAKVFPIKARLYCERRRVMLALIGEANTEYHWEINIQGALYKGTYKH